MSSRTTEPGTGWTRPGSREWQLGTDAASSPTPAVAGRSPGREAWTGSDEGEGLATFLGWFSVGLGAAELLAPRGVARLIGLKPTTSSSAVLRLAGLRELASGVGILSNPKSKEWVGSRIGGDAVDVALLGVALAKSHKPQRALLAGAAVLGVTALDIRGTEQLARSRKAPTPEIMQERGIPVLKSVTIERPRHEVYAFWRNFTNLPHFMRHLESVEITGDRRSHWVAQGPAGARAEWDAELTEERENDLIAWRSLGGAEVYNAGTVRFRDAPGNRGTVVTVEMHYAPPGGYIGAAILRLFRREPGQEVFEDLRRLKQVLETGDVVLSDATATPGPHPGRPPSNGQG